MLYAALLGLHLIAAAFWVGGMAAMHLAVRPAAVDTLEPPQRLPFMASALDRFFGGVTFAIVGLLVSGLAMIWLAGGFGAAHWHVHTMFGVGLLMMAIFSTSASGRTGACSARWRRGPGRRPHQS
jgi:uncharacterized membrane protein